MARPAGWQEAVIPCCSGGRERACKSDSRMTIPAHERLPSHPLSHPHSQRGQGGRRVQGGRADHAARIGRWALLLRAERARAQLDGDESGDDIQNVLAELTGGRSVPRVFIGGSFLGGGDETAAAAANGTLVQKLSAVGAI